MLLLSGTISGAACADADVFVGIEWGTDRSLPMITKKADSFIRLGGDPASGVERGQMAHSLRSLGSAALNYSLVAEGGLEVYWCAANTPHTINDFTD